MKKYLLFSMILLVGCNKKPPSKNVVEWYETDNYIHETCYYSKNIVPEFRVRQYPFGDATRVELVSFHCSSLAQIEQSILNQRYPQVNLRNAFEGNGKIKDHFLEKITLNKLQIDTIVQILDYTKKILSRKISPIVFKIGY